MLSQNSFGSNQPPASNTNQQQQQHGNPLLPPSSMMNLNRPSVLTPPSQMPNLTTNPNVLSQALTRPPPLSALMKPPPSINTITPSPGARSSPLLNVPPPKSFLSMPKNALSSQAPPNVSALTTSMPATSQMNKQTSGTDLNSQSFNNVSLSNNSSVASELNNLTNTSLNQSFGKRYTPAESVFISINLIKNTNKKEQPLNTSNNHRITFL
jgi:hypothetical protein